MDYRQTIESIRMDCKKTTEAVKMAVDAYKDASDAFDALQKAMGVRSSDCGFFDIYWRSIEDCIKAVSIAVGDDQNCITWYILSNDYGRNALKYGYDDKSRKIRTVKDLVRLINKGARRSDL